MAMVTKPHGSSSAWSHAHAMVRPLLQHEASGAPSLCSRDGGAAARLGERRVNGRADMRQHRMSARRLAGGCLMAE